MSPGKVSVLRDTEFPRTTVYCWTDANPNWSPLLIERFQMYFRSSASVHIYSLKSTLRKRCQIVFSNEYTYVCELNTWVCHYANHKLYHSSLFIFQFHECKQMSPFACVLMYAHIIVCCIIWFMWVSYTKLLLYGKQRMNQSNVALYMYIQYSYIYIADPIISSFCIVQCHVQKTRINN